MLAGGVMTEVHLCGTCKNRGVFVVPPAVRRCDRCGLDIQQIRAKGRIGCARDYEVFAHEIKECVQKWHGSSVHKGKRPSSRGGG